MRRKDDTLHNTLLECAGRIADTEGIEALNIRYIARSAGVAAGTVYNYFSNKNELLLALTEDYWKITIDEMKQAVAADSFCGQLEEMFYFLKERIDSSGGRLMQSLGNVETAGKERMADMHAGLEQALVQRMEQDPGIQEDLWNETFTKEKYARFIMMNMTMLLRAGSSDFSFFIKIIRRTLY